MKLIQRWQARRYHRRYGLTSARISVSLLLYGYTLKQRMPGWKDRHSDRRPA